MNQSATTDSADVVASTTARPILKWVGGKRQLILEINRRVPVNFNRYFEPFVGGGALFFDLLAELPNMPSHLGDANAELIATYTAVRDDVDGVVAALRTHAKQHSEEHFYAVRKQQPRSSASIAARMIYLNKTCFNGLYRVNRKNEFNTPIGKYVNPKICDEDNLRACARALARAELTCSDFSSVVAIARAGDFVYFDPPYVPVSATSDFVGFTAAGFGAADQERLVGCARRLKEMGVHVLLSNADLPGVRKLYEGFDMERVEARRNVNSKSGNRGSVGELLIW
jgi:DNA adenine methylase